ncbi:MAG: hypothetical protein HW387_825 [Parachlamydiales bacterium]|nr:hypothetical protein [Parachlamydiales bacterium]
MATTNSIFNRGYNWAHTNYPNELSMAATVAKVSMLAAGVLAIGCVVFTISTGSFPVLTAAMVWKGSIEFVMATINVSSCVRLFQKVHKGESADAWKEAAGLVATLFVTNAIGLSIIAPSFDLKILNTAFKAAIFEIGCIANIARGTQIYGAVKGALFQRCSLKEMIQKVSISALVVFTVSAAINLICLDNTLDFKGLRTITATIVGCAAIGALKDKMWQVIMNSYREGRVVC